MGSSPAESKQGSRYIRMVFWIASLRLAYHHFLNHQIQNWNTKEYCGLENFFQKNRLDWDVS